MKDCGCYFCLQIFPEDEIKEWVDDGKTPICPRCGVDSLIFGQVTRGALEQLREFYFGDHDE